MRSVCVHIACSASTDWVDTPCEYFLASDASAVIEHTKRVIFLEDEDVAFIQVLALVTHTRISGNLTASDRL